MTTRFFEPAGFTPFADEDAIWGLDELLSVNSVLSEEVFGTGVVRVNRLIIASGLASLQAFGSPFLPGPSPTLFVQGIASLGAFGNAQLILFSAPANWKKIQLISPITTDDSVLFGFTGGPPTTDDWYEYSRFSTDGFEVFVNSNGTFFINGSNGTDPSDSFQGRWYSTLERVWSSLQTITMVSSPFTLGAITIPSKEIFGSISLSAQSGGITSVGNIASVESFGNLTLILAGVMRPASILSGQAFGTTLIIAGLRAFPFGIPSEEFFTSPRLLRTLRAGVIASQEAFGGIQLTNFTNKLSPVFIQSEESISIPALKVGRIIGGLGVSSLETFGQALIFSPGVWDEELPLDSTWEEEEVL